MTDNNDEDIEKVATEIAEAYRSRQEQLEYRNHICKRVLSKLGASDRTTTRSIQRFVYDKLGPLDFGETITEDDPHYETFRKMFNEFPSAQAREQASPEYYTFMMHELLKDYYRHIAAREEQE